MGYLEMLSENRMTLIMSLPKNDPDLCMAAFAAGADIVKVHINIDHRASGTHFGRLDEEMPALKAMLSAAAGPVGIVPGNSPENVMLDLHALNQMPFAFYSAYAHHAPAALMRSGKPVMAACDNTYTDMEIADMGRCGAAVIEASVVPGSEYGRPITMRDLMRYMHIASLTTLPVVVPTQTCIRPEDVPQLIACGVRGLMIGAIVTGTTKASISDTVRAFRAAIDACKE